MAVLDYAGLQRYDGKIKQYTGDLVDTVVEVTDTQPSDEYNKIWITPSAEDVELAEMSDVGEVKSAIDTKILPYVLYPATNDYYAGSIFSSGYISATGVEGSNSQNARSVYFRLDEILAVELPTPYRVMFCWYSATGTEGFIDRTTYVVCGNGVVNYLNPPNNATLFRMVVVKTPASTISSSDRTALSEAVKLYNTEKLINKSFAYDTIVDDVFSKRARATNSISKGKYWSDGASTSNTAYARSSDIPCSPSKIYALEIDPSFIPSVTFWSGSSVSSSDFISKKQFRYNNESHKYVFKTPDTAVYFGFDFHAPDWHDITTADVTTITNSFKLFNSCLPQETANYTSAEARAEFVSYMAAMCEQIGMNDTTFVNACGLTDQSVITAADELKMALAVAGNPKALDIWSTRDRTFEIGGDHARTISVESNVLDPWNDETGYKKLGGKGGTLAADAGGGYKRKATIGLFDVNGVPVAVSLIGKGDWIYSNINECNKELIDMMEIKLSGGTPSEGEYLSEFITEGGGYATVPVPICSEAYANNCSVSDILARANVLKNNEDAVHVPASTTKTMTMLCALNVVSDLQEVIQVVSGDIKGGSGTTFYAGDKLTYEDALRIMMMESSNTLAEAIGHRVGCKLLETKCARG